MQTRVALIVGLGAFLLFTNAQAEEPKAPCFDLTQPSTALLKAAPTKFEIEKDVSSFGTDSKTNNDWGQVSGVIKKPITNLIEQLVDPKTIRDNDNTTVKVQELKIPGFLKRFQEKIIIKPFLFITIEWTEDWGISVKDGTLKAPKSVVVAYQKTEGTSHIKHFCGNMVLETQKDGSTGIFLYEEVQADRRSAEDVMNGLIGTLRTLRK